MFHVNHFGEEKKAVKAHPYFTAGDFYGSCCGPRILLEKLTHLLKVDVF